MAARRHLLPGLAVATLAAVAAVAMLGPAAGGGAPGPGTDQAPPGELLGTLPAGMIEGQGLAVRRWAGPPTGLLDEAAVRSLAARYGPAGEVALVELVDAPPGKYGDTNLRPEMQGPLWAVVLSPPPAIYDAPPGARHGSVRFLDARSGELIWGMDAALVD
ncbi:MAG: hypothetical protein IT303_19055 [Dehalococcoidia bacterium]|nr:hypothetical protein [Dehalococcoidia bacterium]